MEKPLCKPNCSYGKVSHALKTSLFWNNSIDARELLKISQRYMVKYKEISEINKSGRSNTFIYKVGKSFVCNIRYFKIVDISIIYKANYCITSPLFSETCLYFTLLINYRFDNNSRL